MRIIWRMLAQIQLPTSELPAGVAQIRALYEWRVIRQELRNLKVLHPRCSLSALAIYHSSRLRAVWKSGWLRVNPWVRKVRKPLRNSLGATCTTRLKALLNVASES